MPACQVLVRALFLVHMTEDWRVSLESLLIRSLITLMRTLPSQPDHYPQAPPSKPIIILGIRLSIHILEGSHKYSDHSSHIFQNFYMEFADTLRFK